MIDIVVVTFNRLKYLKLCVGSLLETTEPDDRIVIVDNASFDGTDGYVLDMQAKTKGRVFYRRMEENCGCDGGRNMGFQATRSDIVLLSDDDFFYYLDWRTVVQRAFAADPKLGLVSLHDDLRESQMEEVEVRPGLYLKYRGTLAHGSSAVRRTAFEAVGGYDGSEKVMGFFGSKFCRKLNGAGWRVAIADTGFLLAEHMDHPASQFCMRSYYDRSGYNSFRGEAKKGRVRVGDNLKGFFR